MSFSDRSMRAGLRALNRLASSDLVDRVGLRRPAERLIFNATKNGFRGASAAARAFTAVQRLGRPARLPSASSSGLFDLSPSDEQEMLADAVGQFAAERVRPIAQQADSDCETPVELVAQSAELGITTVGVPEELGGVVGERAAVTAVLIAEALAHGDMGVALACLAPAGVSTALGLWGDEDQQARYLPPFVGEDVPAAAFALLEPRPLFDPFELETTARRDGDGFVLDGVKSLVPVGARAELFVVAAALDGAPALFVVESGGEGLAVEPEPAMGLRPAGTSRVTLAGLRVPAGALLGGGEEAVYSEAVQLARLGWCALAVGTGQAVLDYVKQYVNERKAFGEPISNRQAVAFEVANIAIELDGMRLATYRAASLADQGKPFAREAAVARRLCAEHAMKIGSSGVQLLGGHGYVKEHPVERWYRDLRAAGLMEGALLV